ncbi:MAG: HI0074 family nucleotidyltransferase substrate-binding subunit [Candidatus Sabulitectum sp.]|nr:HI0074 family nucleotidyltransferase substrate-binding subunit [Candidatus Sabulitectum sp.]
MNTIDETRWQQRFDHFARALTQLKLACGKKEFSVLERAGLIQIFGYTFELSWKTLKDLLLYEGYDLKSPRQVIRKSFELAFVSEENCELFLNALLKRNLLSHTYEEETALEAERLITNYYYPLLTAIHNQLEQRLHEN